MKQFIRGLVQYSQWWIPTMYLMCGPLLAYSARHPEAEVVFYITLGLLFLVKVAVAHPDGRILKHCIKNHKHALTISGTFMTFWLCVLAHAHNELALFLYAAAFLFASGTFLLMMPKIVRGPELEMVASN